MREAWRNWGLRGWPACEKTSLAATSREDFTGILFCLAKPSVVGTFHFPWRTGSCRESGEPRPRSRARADVS